MENDLTMERERIIETKIPDGTLPVRLDRYLSGRFDYLSRSSWRREIIAGKINVNGVAVTDSSKLIRGNDLIAYDGRSIVEPEVDDAIDVLFRDDRCVAIGKSGDLPVHPAGRYFNKTLTAIMEKRLGQKIYPVHRLDRETSGIILCVFDTADAAVFSAAIQSGCKEYLAIVHGHFPDGEMTVDLSIGQDEGAIVTKKRKAYPEASETALTRFCPEGHFGAFSLVRCFPKTGRLHQIRAHLLAAGYPIVGDKMYGTDERLFLEFVKQGMTDDLLSRLILPRCALHAERLVFIHPITKKEMIIVSPIPTMFTGFLERCVNG
jgi:RluA family pseudouridine synthase